MSTTPRAFAAVTLGVAAALTVSAAPASAAERFTPGAPGAGDPYFPDMGNGGYDVAHYDVGLKYDPATKGIRAVTKIKARATQNLSRFNLDFLGPLTISSLKVDGHKASFKRTGAQELVITPRKGLRKHRHFTVTVAYSGVPQPINDATLGTSGWIPTADGAVMVNQPFGAATVYPVNDHPTDKATYTFTLTAPKGHTTLSNGDLRGTSTKGGWTTTRWVMRHPMASELSMLAIGKYDVITGRTGDGVPNLTATDRAQGVTPEDAQKFHRQTAEIQDFQASLYGRYPFTSTGGIVVKGGFGYALETQGRPVYDLGRRPGAIPSGSLVAHELGHQWFGDSVTPERWADIWMNEGFATYSEWLYAEKFEGTPVQESFDAVYATPADDGLWKGVVSDPGRDHIFDGLVYDRGAMAVHVLRQTIGENAFYRLLREWPATYRYGNASTEDLVRFAERLSHKKLDAWADAWLYSEGKPSV
ncbi:M1 family metallopeptidase [Actinomadura livida]|uniref:Aminopeptidase N n=1 Tax=Actinomadura livida TaxID=79909 RepID=A0A7W7IA36_9ACTN|nr:MULTISPECIES: M1 family metallopeptidase [Actinomadura]MBB4773230.1 aminopeptidase N [Actinomadura catellatispora]GGU18959.1 peptidase [Actinomadura livida]